MLCSEMNGPATPWVTWRRFTASRRWDCWEWQGALDRGGYGKLSGTDSEGKRRHIIAHRFVYEQLIGPIPDGLTIDHLCLNKACVNPYHLEPVSNRENIRRAAAHGLLGGARKTHCKYGHEFSPENTRRDKHGHRSCRACARIHQLKLTNIKRQRRLDARVEHL